MLTLPKVRLIRTAAGAIHDEIRAIVETSFPVDPGVIAEVVGLTYREPAGIRYVVAGGLPRVGMLDRESRTVTVAGEARSDWKRLTALHEIGVAVLTEETVHADVAITGAERVTPDREPAELAADIFAIEVAAPADAVVAAFLERFGAPIDDHSDPEWVVRNLSASLPRHFTALEFVRAGRRRRAMWLAAAAQFGAQIFRPLDRTFGISPAAMAIRFEELRLAS